MGWNVGIVEGWNVGFFKDATYFYFFLEFIVAIKSSQHRTGTHHSTFPVFQYSIWGEAPCYMAHFGKEFKIKKGIGRGLFPLRFQKKQFYRFEN